MTNPAKIRSAIVDDELHSRLFLAELIFTDPRFDIYGQYRNGQQAIDSLQKDLPDVIF